MAIMFGIFLVLFAIGGLLVWIELIRIAHTLEGIEESFDIWRKKH